MSAAVPDLLSSKGVRVAMPSDRLGSLRGDPAYVRPHIERPPLEGRAAAVELLLIKYRDVTETATPAGPGTGSHIPLMPHAASCRLLTDSTPFCSCHLRSVRELERLLTRMRAERRSQWWHVTERYLRCPQATKDMPVKRRAKNGKTVTELERMLVYLVSPAVRLEKVRRGLHWLASEWSLDSEPMLPAEYLATAKVAA